MSTDEKELCLYVVTQDRVSLLNRMLFSVLSSSRLPERIIIITSDKHIHDSIQTAFIRRIFKEYSIGFDVVICEKTSGLSERKNIALTLMQAGEYAYGMSIDDDMVLDPHCIERLMHVMAEREDIFAVGPTVLQPSATGLPKTPELFQAKMVEIVDSEWQWRGFIQGISSSSLRKNLYEVEHLAGCYLHRNIEGDTYDEAYDRPGNFLHESDFLFRRGLLAVKNAIVHHWPPVAITLWDSKEKHKEHILQNARYFATKHDLGYVQSIQWEGFKEVENTGDRKLSKAEQNIQ